MSTALAHKNCDDTSLKDEVERHWREIIKHSYRFEQQQAEVCVVIQPLKSNAYSEALQYRQDILPITISFPTYTMFRKSQSENSMRRREKFKHGCTTTKYRLIKPPKSKLFKNCRA